MSAAERLKNVGNVGRADPRTTIFDGYPYFVSLFTGSHLCADTCPTTVTVVLDRISYEILHDSLKRITVAFYRWQVRLDHCFYFETRLLHFRLAGANCAIDDVRHR